MDQIQEIKRNHGQSSESIIANGLGLVSKGKKYHCPNIYAHKNNDKNPSMSWDPKALQFHCFTCGMNIDIYGYYRDHLNYTHQEVMRELLNESDYKKTSMQVNRNTFTQELKNIKPINDNCIKYIELRGITKETIDHFKLKSYKGMIAFPYHKYNSIVGYKTRKPMKNPGKNKMLSITGSKPYLFNAQNVEEGNELVICEGEFDCMCIHQAGYNNVVSVGAGANSMTSLLEQAKDFLNKFEILIIVSDNDDAGNDMDKAFIETFGDKAKLIDKKLYGKKKNGKSYDINEEYVLNGSEKVQKIIESGRWKIEGRRDLEQKPYQGLQAKTGSYIPTGIGTIDYAINDLAPGCTTLITGRSNGGKTTFVRQVIANSINKDNKVYLVSGEGDQEIFINELYQSVVGRDEQYYNLIKINKRYRKEPKAEILKQLQEWHKKKLTLFHKGDSKLKTMDDLLKMIEIEIKVNKHDLVVIDNLMSVLSIEKANEKNERQADFMQKLSNLAGTYNTHIVLVLHPNKTYQKGKDMDFEQISGTSDLYNKADNIIAVIREPDETVEETGRSGRIQVLKNRYYPELPIVDVHFEKETGLLLEIEKDTNQIIGYTFNWKNKKEIEFEKIPDDAPF